MRWILPAVVLFWVALFSLLGLQAAMKFVLFVMLVLLFATFVTPISDWCAKQNDLLNKTGEI